MGIGEWVARKGNVGGTARWAAKLYLDIKKTNPQYHLDNVLSEIICARYSGDKMAPYRDATLNVLRKNNVRGLAHLVTLILTTEASYNDNSMEDKVMFLRIIQEEMEKLGVTRKVINRE